jgi:hypothetical protein
MQIYLHQNNQQEGPFTLPRISARLVSGDLDSATLAWHEGMDTWYPLTHEKWQALGIVAPAPKPKPAVQENTPVVQEAENDNDSPEVDLSSEPAEDESVVEPESGADTEEVEVEPETEAEPSGPAFASYTEEDFKPPSFEEMEKDMTELRRKRAGFPEQIGRRAHEINFRDEDIEEAWADLEKSLASGKEEDSAKAFASLGQAILSAGLNDPGLDELRDEEREVADRMLNLQVQLRRMGGAKQRKGPAPWKKWVILGITFLLFAGIITFIVLSG